MSDQHTPTISVKKADGSTVKMTLDEFRAYKAQKGQSGPAPIPIKNIDPNSVQGTPLQPNEVVTPAIPATQKSLASALPENLPMVEQSQALSVSTPTIVGEAVKEMQSSEPGFEAESAPEPAVVEAPQIQDLEPLLPTEEFSSPLEDVAEEVQTSPHNPVSDINEKITNDIIAPIAFLVSAEVEPKLHALVLSRVKEIRTESQVKEMALMTIEQGGLGLDEMKLNILLHAIQEGMKQKPVAAPLPSAQAKLKPVVPPIATLNKDELKPVDAIAKKTIVTKPDAQKILSSLIAEDSIQAQIMKPTYTRIESGKVQMQDVVARPTSVGPVDEMMNFSLVDFRRLGASPAACADNLIKKFTLFKTDSYLLFLQGRAAWFKSPLYQMYLGTLERSLALHKTLSNVIQMDQDTMNMEELSQVVRVNQSLNF